MRRSRAHWLRRGSHVLPGRSPRHRRQYRARRSGSLLDLQPSDCPVDTVVIVVMENRSFDHYLGWLGSDDAYLEAGRRRTGSGSRSTVSSTRSSSTAPVVSWRRDRRRATRSRRPRREAAALPTRPTAGSRRGWRAITASSRPPPATTSSRSPTTRATTCPSMPHWRAASRCSIAGTPRCSGPTFPNRQYLLSAQSEGRKTNRRCPRVVTRRLPRGDDRRPARRRPASRSATTTRNVPLLALWGYRMAPYIRSLDRYFEDAAVGRLPEVAFVEPQFGGGDVLRTDDHPRGDIGLGQRWIREVFRAFASSPHWATRRVRRDLRRRRRLLRPREPPPLRRRPGEHQRRRQLRAGRVPGPDGPGVAVRRRGSVDHRLYDHTSIMRFLSGGSSAHRPKAGGVASRWALTLRDRATRNMGATLRPSTVDPHLGFDLRLRIPQPAPACTAGRSRPGRRRWTPTPIRSTSPT